MNHRNTPTGVQTAPLFTRIPSRDWGVYRIYDRDGVLIYVGMSGQPRKRLRRHVARFGQRFHTYTWTPATSEHDAGEMESAAIHGENPVENIARGTGRFT